jgi:hypothetical protein
MKIKYFICKIFGHLNKVNTVLEKYNKNNETKIIERTQCLICKQKTEQIFTQKDDKYFQENNKRYAILLTQLLNNI